MPGDVRAEAAGHPTHTLKGILKPTLKGTLSTYYVHAAQTPHRRPTRHAHTPPTPPARRPRGSSAPTARRCNKTPASQAGTL